jgi:predicted porin
LQKKKLGLLAMGLAASAAACAQSSVTLYGLVDTNIRYEHNKTAPASGNRWSLEDGAYSGPRWGLTGSEDLGAGLRAIFKLEAGFDLGTGLPAQASATAGNGEVAAPTGRAFGRESWVGFTQPRAGTVLLGRYYTFAHLVSSRFQAMSNPNMSSLSVFSGHQRARQDNMVTYTNHAGPVGFGVQKAFGEQPNNDGGNSSWNAFASYEAGPLYFGGYVEDIQNLAGSDTRHIRGAGGSYKFDDRTQVFAGFMRRSQDVSKQRNKVWTAAVNYYLAPTLLLTVSHITDDQTGTAAVEGTRKVDFVGLDYLLSKRTDLYAIVDHNKITGGYTPPANMIGVGSQTGLSLGIRHKF